MEKISRIIPSSARVGGVDMKSANPVRPGTPAFGRPVAESRELPREAMTTAQKAMSLREEISNQRKLGEQPEIVQRMTEQFFMQKSAAGVEARPTSEHVGAVGNVVANAEIEEEALVLPQVAQRKDFVPPGSYVDVVA